MFKTVRNLLRNRAGSTIIMVGLALPVIFLAVGGAIDFGRVLQLRGELQDAADVASVGSVAVNSKAFKLALTQGDGEITQGSQQAGSIFESDMHPAAELSGLTVNAKVSKASTMLTSLVTVSANYKPYIIGLFGFNTLPLSVTSKSSATIPPYIDFYLLLDNTPSMGLGATYDDINKMMTATANSPNEQKCAFACHETGPFAGHTPTSPERYGLAKQIGVTMRIDVVRQATQQLMTTANNTQSLPGQYRMAIYDFGTSAATLNPWASPPAYAVSALTSNLTQSASDAGKIDLMTIPYQNYNTDQQTNFKSVMAYMNQKTVIADPGDGTSSSSPQKVLFFVSDGMMDSYDCSQGGSCRRLGGLDVPSCTAIKNRGVRIAVLYTTYLRLVGAYAPSDPWYKNNVDKYISPTNQVAANMQACASPGLFFEVGPDQGISEAMTALFNKVVSVVRIRS